MVKQPAASIPSAGGGWEVAAAATRAVPGGELGEQFSTTGPGEPGRRTTCCVDGGQSQSRLGFAWTHTPCGDPGWRCESRGRIPIHRNPSHPSNRRSARPRRWQSAFFLRMKSGCGWPVRAGGLLIAAERFMIAPLGSSRGTSNDGVGR